MEKYSHLAWVTNIYWYMEKYSCVLCVRNKNGLITYFYFKKYVGYYLKNKKGYDHRRPNQKKKKENYQVGRFKRKYYQNKRIIKFRNSPSIKNNTMVIKVRTQSFEDSNN